MSGRAGKRLGVIGVGFFIFTICLFSLSLSVKGEEGVASGFHPQRILVKFKSSIASIAKEEFLIKYDLKVIRRIPKIDIYLLQVKKGRGILSLLSRLKKEKIVEFAEPDYIRKASYTPNDPYYPEQWGLLKIGIEGYWDAEMGSSGVVVAILDTGIDLDHPDLVNRLWVNPGEIPDNGIDDDGNGYVDDVYGYDFAGDGLFPLPGAEDSNPDDGNGHGTHVAGRVGAETDNLTGVAGIAQIQLMAVKVMSSLGIGYSSDIIEGVIYAVDNGAKVINASLGGTSPSLAEYLAYEYAYQNNVFIAAASGNNGHQSNSIEYPAGYFFAMGVGATDQNDMIAYFSTHGPQVEVSAPGVEILSTTKGGGYGYKFWSGTSMACPHVTGLAALLYSRYPGLANWQARLMIREGVIDRGVVGWDEFYGFGRVDAPTLLIFSPPSSNQIYLLSPLENSQLSNSFLLTFAWSPVEGASSYRLTILTPGGRIKRIFTSNTYYTVLPSLWSRAPTGVYYWKAEALDSQGDLISEGTSYFEKL